MGKRPPRAVRSAAQAAKAINEVLLGNKRPQAPQPAVAGPSSASTGPPSLSFVSSPRSRVNVVARPRPSGGIGVKNMQAFRRRNRNIKIKKLLTQPRPIEVKKNGVVIRKMVVRRKSYFPGKRAKVY